MRLTLVDVRQHTTLGDGDMSQELVQLLVVSDSELKMTGDDTCLLVVTSSVASQLKNFGGEVLEDSSEVDRGTGTDTLGVVALPQKTVDTTNRERETSLGRTAKMMLIRLRRDCSVATYDCAFLEPEALPPDLPPPVILK